MPARRAENLYTLEDDDGYRNYGGEAQAWAREEGSSEEEDQQLLSPSDGYFGMSQSQLPGAQQPEPPAGSLGPPTRAMTATSSQAPHVPDVWVQDPSLQQGYGGGGSKAREASSSTNDGWKYPVLPQSRRDSHTWSAAAAALGSPPSTADRSSWTPPPSAPHPRRYAETRSSAWSVTPLPSTTANAPWGHHGAAGSPGLYNGQTVTSLHSEAPPAYSPRNDPDAAASPSLWQARQLPQSPAQRNYYTFPGPSAIMGGQESQGLLSGTSPESMGGYPVSDEEDVDGITPRWKQHIRKRWSFVHSKLCRGILLGLVLFTITIVFLTASVKSIRGIVIDPPLGSKEPESVTRPSEPSGPSNPSSPPVPSTPPYDYPPFDGDILFPPSSKCGDPTVERVEQYEFLAEAGKSLSLRQEVDREDQPPQGTFVNVYGDIFFRRTRESPKITVEIKTNDERVSVDLNYNPTSQVLVLKVPRKIEWDGSHKWPCLHIRVNVAIPEGGVVDSLRVSTVQLGVKLLDNLSMGVQSSALINTTVGKVVAAVGAQEDLDQLIRDGAPEYFRFESRYISIKTTSADIEGSWPLYDYLGIESTAGKIKAGIEPKPAAESTPEVDAKLHIKTTSGSVQFWEPIDKARQALLRRQDGANVLATTGLKSAEEVIPPRNYDVNVHTTSGSIKGAAAFTYFGKFHSTSGSVAVDLLPVLPSELAAEALNVAEARTCSLESSSTSGSTTIHVLEPIWIDTSGYSTAPAAAAVPAQPPAAPHAPTPFMPPTAPADGADPERGIVVPVGGRPASNWPSGNPASLPPLLGLPIPPSAPQQQQQQQQQAQATAEATAKFLRVLRSRHSTTSARLGIRLPGSWEGDVAVDTLSGTVTIAGDGVKMIRADVKPGKKSYLARKGDSEEGHASRTGITTISGTIDVRVG